MKSSLVNLYKNLDWKKKNKQIKVLRYFFYYWNMTGWICLLVSSLIISSQSFILIYHSEFIKCASNATLLFYITNLDQENYQIAIATIEKRFALTEFQQNFKIIFYFHSRPIRSTFSKEIYWTVSINRRNDFFFYQPYILIWQKVCSSKIAKC